MDAASRIPVAIGGMMEAGAVGWVTATQHPEFAAGEHVYGGIGVQEFARSDGTGVTKLDPLLAPPGASLQRRTTPMQATYGSAGSAADPAAALRRAAAAHGLGGPAGPGAST